MGHNHSHDHNIDLGQKNIRTAFYLNLGFTVAEIIGGIITNSMAITADALHDFGDSISLGLSWYFAKLSGKKPTEQFSYGYKRFSLLAALINGFILLLGSLFILSEAVPRIVNPEQPNAKGMLFFALFGVLVNGTAVWKLKSGKTLNERVVTWHLLEDVLGWVAVFIVSVVMLIKDIPILDPILSILITLYILWNVVKNLKKTVILFLQGVPDAMSIEKIENKIKGLDFVKGIHDIHVWSLDGEKHILTAHIVVSSNLLNGDIVRLKVKVKNVLEKLGIQHTTLEFEFDNEECETNCNER